MELNPQNLTHEQKLSLAVHIREQLEAAEAKGLEVAPEVIAKAVQVEQEIENEITN